MNVIYLTAANRQCECGCTRARSATELDRLFPLGPAIASCETCSGKIEVERPKVWEPDPLLGHRCYMCGLENVGEHTGCQYDDRATGREVYGVVCPDCFATWDAEFEEDMSSECPS